MECETRLSSGQGIGLQIQEVPIGDVDGSLYCVLWKDTSLEQGLSTGELKVNPEARPYGKLQIILSKMNSYASSRFILRGLKLQCAVINESTQLKRPYMRETEHFPSTKDGRNYFTTTEH